MYEMLWAHGHGSFAGYARKLCADVDAWTALCDMRQYRGSVNPLSSNGTAFSKGQKTRVAYTTFGFAGPGSVATVAKHFIKRQVGIELPLSSHGRARYGCLYLVPLWILSFHAQSSL